MRDQTDIAVHASSTAASELVEVHETHEKHSHTMARTPAVFGTRTLRGFVIATIAAPLLAMLGALGTDSLLFWPRLGYWLILMESGAMIGLGVSYGLEIWGRLLRWPWVHMAAAAFLIALPLTLIVVGTTTLFFRTPPPEITELVMFLGVVFLISFVITALNYLMRLPGETVSRTLVGYRDISPVVLGMPAPTPAILAPGIRETPFDPEKLDPALAHSVSTTQIRFSDRLPSHLRSATLIALEAEDHYLRVHTDAGAALILMRLSDAIAELAADPAAASGAQTHRSWWVAQSAITSVVRTDGRAALKLANGIEAPVSRTHYKSLNSARWFNA